MPSQSSLLMKKAAASSDPPRAKAPSEEETRSRFPNGFQNRTPVSPEPKDKSAESSEENAESSEESAESIQESAESSEDDEPTFKIDHARAPSKTERASKGKPRKQSGRDEKGIWPKTQPCLDNSKMEVYYRVLPGPRWESMRTYQSFRAHTSETFRVGDYVYINYSNVTDKSFLKPDERNYWVCFILEVRASDAQHIYLRVWWLYWPDELPSPSPGGRRAYHGEHELLMSNDMGIINALTVAGSAKVTRWDEWQDDSNGEEGGISLGGLYWRQWYNCVTKRMSMPRPYCVCRQAYNPDGILVGCSNTECSIWMHERCLTDDALLRRYRQLVSGNVSKLKLLEEYIETRLTTSKNEKVHQPDPPWAGQLEATLDSRTSPTKSVVTNLKYPHKAPREQNLLCLKCQTVLE